MARKLMVASGVVHGIVGVLLIFIPEELLLWTDGNAGDVATLAVSITGAAILGIGMLNYVGRSAIHGGIYGKPILMGNLIFHTVAAISLIKFSLGATGNLMICAALAGILYLIFAAGFIRLNFFPADR